MERPASLATLTEYKQSYTPMGNHAYYGLVQFILWFLLIAVVVWVLLFTFNFPFTRSSDGSGQQDLGRILISAIIIALIIVIIAWLLMRNCGSC